MPKHKSLLHRVDIELAKHRRKCRHKSDHVIRQNEISLVIREGQYQRRVYCRACGLRMIETTKASLNEIEKSLVSASGSGLE
jgi:hypothetical protein